MLELLFRDVIDARDNNPVYLPSITFPRFSICDLPGVGFEVDAKAQELDRKLEQTCEMFPLVWPIPSPAGRQRKIRIYNPFVEVHARRKQNFGGWWVEASPKILNPFTGETGLFLRIVRERRQPLGGSVYWVALAGTENGVPSLTDLDVADATG